MLTAMGSRIGRSPGDDMPAFFCRGSGHNEWAQYSERPDDYQKNVDRLARKFETARNWMPAPVVEINRKASIGIIAYGTTHWAILESRDQLSTEADLQTSYYRVCAYPFRTALASFIERHERAYIVEQNRDAQMLSLMKLDLPVELTGRLRSVLHYAGNPIDARTVTENILIQEGYQVQKADADFERAPRNAGVGGEKRSDHQRTNIVATVTRSRPEKRVNRIGLESKEYRGAKTTLCAGCGHNAISERIIGACYEMGIDPERVIKLSGIGCSSKSPAYFLGSAHGFNAVHGRMPSVWHGRALGQQAADRSRRERRRGYRRDRDRSVRPPDAAQSTNRLHHRGQRLLRPDEGPVLTDGGSGIQAEDRRGQ